MECEGSLLHSQQHATCPYSKHNILPPHHSLCPLPILVWVSSVTSFLDVLWPNILYVSNLHCALCSTHFVSLHLTRCTATTCSSLNLRFTPNLNDIYSYMFLQHTFYSLHKHTHTHTHTHTPSIWMLPLFSCRCRLRLPVLLGQVPGSAPHLLQKSILWWTQLKCGRCFSF